jgi:hypothetical protein
MSKVRTLTKDQLNGRANGPFIAGEDMESFRQGKEIRKGQQAYLLEGHICLNERDAMAVYSILHKDELLD